MKRLNSASGLGRTRVSRHHYRTDIDALRALAVLLVVLYHLEIPYCEGGFVGVDVFFVISGYLITRNINGALDDERFSLKNFYQRRIKRLFPALITTLFITLLLGCSLLPPSHLMALAKNTFGATFSLSNIFFWQQTSYFDDALKINPLLHTWSLSLEEQFYLIYPILLIGLARMSFRIRLGWMWSLSLISLGASVWLSATRPYFAFYMVPARFWEFSIGGLFAWYEPQLRERLLIGGRTKIHLVLITVGIGAIVGASVTLDESSVFPSFLALVPCLGALALIASGLPTRGVLSVLQRPTIIKVGKMSYAIYLVHWPLIALYRQVSFDLILEPWEQIGLFVVTLIAAYGLHIGVENPLRYREHLIARVSVLRGALIASMVSCLCVVGIWASDGLMNRFDLPEKQRLPLMESSTAFKKAYYGGQGCKPPRCTVGLTPKTHDALDPQLQSGRTDSKHVTSDEISPRAFVIGDSYALTLFQGIQAYLEAEGLVFWERGGCEFFSRSYIGSRTKGRRKCLESKRAAFAEIRAHPEVPVVLGQHWYAQFLEVARRHAASIAIISDDVTESDDAARRSLSFDELDAYAQFVALELIELKSALGSRRFTVLGGPPKFAHVFSPLDCLLGPTSRPEPYTDCSRTPLNEITRWHQRFTLALRRHAHGNFEVIDLYPPLCDDQVCLNFLPTGEPIYSDYGHLSVWGSRFVVSGLKDQFSRALELPIRQTPRALPQSLPRR